jgi:arylsulfatase A
MNGKTKNLSVVLALILLSLCAHAATDTVLLLHTNDLHDHLRPGLDGRGGLAYVVGYVRGVRTERSDVILVDAGDVVNKGDMLPSITNGEAIYTAMKRACYDVIAPGNHCFRYGLDQLFRNASLAGTDLLCANGVMQDRSDFPFCAAKIVDVDGTKVGVIGFALPGLVPRGGECTILDLDRTAEVLAARTAEIDVEAHLVVAVGHANSQTCTRLARRVPAIDVFVSGHSHEILHQPIVLEDVNTLIVQAGSNAKFVGRLELTIDLETEAVVSHTGALVELRHDTSPLDRTTAELIRQSERATCPQAQALVGQIGRSISTPQLTKLYARALRQKAGVDIGICHQQRVMGGFMGGQQIDGNAVFASYQGDGRELVSVSLKGADLTRYLDAAQKGKNTPAWDGFTAQVDYDKPAGQRVTQSSLKPEQDYLVIIPAEQIKTLTVKLRITIPEQSITPYDYTTVDALREYIEAFTASGETVQPIENRDSPLNSDTTAPTRIPNFVVIFCDDMGYADIGPFGAEGYRTPHLDRMAQEGMTFTDFYVGRSFCSPSRAALMTGCIPTRVGIGGNFGPKSITGLNPNEMTIAEVLKQKGYATACFGKWHLGHLPRFLPPNQGFDEYFGIPYSNDMWPFHPNVRHLPMEERLKRWPHLPLYEGTKVINPELMPEDQVLLTTRIFERAVTFINENSNTPFFIYLPSPQPHVPLFVSETYQGNAERGLFGDVISEIDWGVGRIVDALKQNGIDENTCLVFSSDNGPWLMYGDHAGSAKPLREGKGTNFEGGFRVPCLMRWPGRIPAGAACREMASTMDLLPTFARLAGAPQPVNKIDGKDISGLMFSRHGAKTPHEVFYYYDGGNRLMALRSGKWKLMFAQTYTTSIPGKGGIPGKGQRKTIELSLFDLESDIGETTNVADEYPDAVERLKGYAEQVRKDLGHGKDAGPGRRPIGRQ